MSLLNEIGSMLGGGGEQGGGGIQGALMGLLGGQDGGLAGLAQKFQAGGLGEAFASWVGNGENHGLTPEALHGVFGSEMVQQLAAKTGLPVEQLLAQMAEHLPGLVSSVTPNGEMPGTPDGLASAGVSFLKGKFGIG